MKKFFILFSMSLFVLCSLVVFESCDINEPLDLESIELSSDSLDFGLFKNEMEFIVLNTDTLNVYWVAQPSYEWIEIEPLNGILESDVPDTIRIKVDRSQLLDGPYEGDVILEFDSTIETILINVSLLMRAVVEIPTTPIEFGVSDTSFTFSITNSGNFPLEWSCTPADPWITVIPDTGTVYPDTTTQKVLLKSDNNSTDVKVIIDKNGLPPGHHESAIILHTNNGIDTLRVSVDISADPLFAISTQTLDFSSNETSLGVIIANAGGGTVDWNSSVNSNWVSVSPSSGSLTTESSSLSKTDARSDTIIVEVNRSGIAPGNYSDQIEFTSNGGDHTLTVQMSVAENPILGVSSTSLDFGEQSTSEEFSITNTGTGTLNWQVTSNKTWLGVSPASGSVTTGQSSITATVNRNGLAPGSYDGTISITSNGGNQDVQVSMVVPEPVVEIPELSYSPSSFDFGTTDSSGTILITNIGTGTLNWELSNSDGWINFTPVNGTTTVENDQVELTISRQGLAPGDYSGLIAISSDGGSGTISVAMKVDEPSPELSFTPEEFNFSKNDSSGVIEINNIGAGILNWQLAKDKDWIIIDETSGSTTTEPSTIDISIDPTSLAPGTHSGNIEITSDGGNGTIVVSVTIEEPIAELSYSPHALQFIEDGDSTQTFVISNTGEGTLDWNLTPSEDWIILSHTSGSTNGNGSSILLKNLDGDSSQVEVTVDYQNKEPGEYDGTIDISSNGGDGSIEIKMIINEKPDLLLTNQLLDFGLETNNLQFSIQNIGSGNLTWYCAEEYDWFSVNPTDGETTTETDIINVNVNRRGLSGGNYNGFITVASNGGEERVEVKMEVEEIPVLEVSQTRVSFSSGTGQKTVQIKNIGEGRLHWSSSIVYGEENSTNYPWLSLDPENGSTRNEDEVTFYANGSILPPDYYTATVTIESDGGTEQIQVTMNIEGPELILSTHYLDFGETETNKSFKIKNGGGGEMNWNASPTAGWISIYPDYGNTTTEDDVVEVSVIRGSPTLFLNKTTTGTRYTGQIIVYTTESTDTVKVEMTIVEPEIQTDPDYEMMFGTETTSKNLDIKNIGGGTLEWGLLVDNINIHIDAANGTCTSGEKKSVTVTPNRDMETGEYYGMITVQSNGGENIYIQVYWTIPEPE